MIEISGSRVSDFMLLPFQEKVAFGRVLTPGVKPEDYRCTFGRNIDKDRVGYRIETDVSGTNFGCFKA